jgi:molecular chaperone GrpE
MSDPNATPDPNDATSQPAQGTTPPQPEGAEPAPEQLKAIIGVLQTDLDKSKTEILRLVADMDNLRKRTEREKQETSRFAISKFAVDIIGVTDNFERAMQAVPPGAAEADPALQSLVEGVGMIDGQLKGVLERHGVKRIWPEGEIFNPHLHQPMQQVDNPDVPNGTILRVFQAGYVIEERVIRPAMVVTARGGPKPGKAEAGNGGAESAAQAAQQRAADDPSNGE